jgi:hypothetical protein
MNANDLDAITLVLFAAVVAIIFLGALQGQRDAAVCRDQDGIVTTIEGQNACVKVLSMLH